ncbi:unnamed protein product [Pedinophyceae sp. YPF-701]|nr:unnamed protein product [Pedinophyceae sp. YPF-701]
MDAPVGAGQVSPQGAHRGPPSPGGRVSPAPGIIDQQDDWMYEGEATPPADDGAGRDLLHLENQMRQADFVMDPQVIQTLREYLRKGGKPEIAIELLADSYAGYAQMASVVGRWLSLATSTAPPAATDAPGDVSDPWHGHEEGGRDAVLALLVAEAEARYSPESFQNAFQPGGAGVPQWFEDLLTFEQGRKLTYRLLEKHPACPLLDYGLRTVIAAGHQEEVAAAGGPVARQFWVYHTILSARLKRAASHPERASAEMRAVVAAALSEQELYLHTLTMLTTLGAHPRGGIFRKAAAELQSQAAQVQGGTVWRAISELSSKASTRRGDARSFSAAANLLSAPAGRVPTAIAALHRLFAAHAAPKTPDTPHEPPPPHALRTLPVLHCLMRAVLPAGSAGAASSQAVALLAEACSADPMERDMVEDTLREATESMRKLASSGAELDSSSLYHIGEVPVASLSALITVEDAYQPPLGDVAATAGPAALQVVHAVLQAQPQLFAEGLRALRALMASGCLQEEDRRRLLGYVVDGLRTAHAAEAMAWLSSWAQQADTDPGDAQFAFLCSLSRCGPPYGAEFVACCAALFRATKLRDAGAWPEGSAERALVEEFARGSREVDVGQLAGGVLLDLWRGSGMTAQETKCT